MAQRKLLAALLCATCLFGWNSGVQAAQSESEAAEDAAAVKNHEFIMKGLVYPAMEASGKGDNERALALHKRAVEEWKSHDYKYKWARDNQRCQMCDSIRHQAEILTRLGRYEDAAQMYRLCDTEWAKYGGEMQGAGLQVGRTYLAGKMYDKAEQTFESIVNSDQVSNDKYRDRP